MKRIPIYILLVALTFIAPVDRVDVGKLQPVEVVAIYSESGQIVLQTDTGDTGWGADAAQALKDLKETAAAVVYLDTAEYLLVQKDIQQYIEPIRKDLKRSVKVCLTDGLLDLKQAGKYLGVHGDCPKLRDWKSGDNLPILTEEIINEKSRI